MNPADYDYLCDFLMKSSGLSLGPNKEYLIESRLIPLAQSYELDGIEELVRELRNGAEPRLKTAVTESMTTNETSFFRDKRPFKDLLSVMIPNLLEARKTTRTIKIWCAASSTGQEPYSIVMSLRDRFPQLKDWTVELLATDIDTTALERAKDGIYSQFEVQRGLPVQTLISHFEQSEQNWQIKEDFRKLITWKQMNLLEDFAHVGVFDIVFCRNILIYFEMAAKSDVLHRIRKVVRDDGYLLLGAAETVLGLCDAFGRSNECESAVYRPVAGKIAAKTG